MFQFAQQLNPAIECITILNRHFSQSPGSPSNLRAHVESYCEKHNIPLGTLLPYAEPLIQIEEHVLNGLLPLDPQAEFLFFCPEGFFPNLAWALYFLEEEKVDFRALSGEALTQELRYLLHITLNCTPEKLEPVHDAASLAAFLQAHPCSTTTKWACSTFWWNPVAHQETFRKILNRAIALFQEVEASAASLLKKALPELEASITSGKDMRILQNLSLEKHECVLVYPFAMRFEGLGIIWSRLRQQAGDVLLLVGILRPTLDALTAKYNNNSELIAGGARALGDIRRVEILNALKKQPMCNQEIAQLLNLSAATVSHHMNSLVREGFVSVSKRGNWMDYSLNADKLRIFLEVIQSTWL